MTDAYALWFQGKDRFSLVKEQLPELRAGWCRIQTIFSAISPGTERLVYSEKIPESLYCEMRCPYMGGKFPYPVKYGYSLVGRIVEGPDESVDKLVHILHPHQDQSVVRLEDVYPVPSTVPPRRATLASNLETAVNAIWDARVSIGERVVVVGFGAVGSLVARLLTLIPEVEVEVVETDAARRELAKQMEFEAYSPAKMGDHFDLAFHVSATAEGLQSAIESVDFEGRIIELSWYGTGSVSLQLGRTFHNQRKRIISSQVANIAPHQRPRWDHQRRKKLVFSLLKRSEFDSHITHTVAFSDLPEVCRQLQQGLTEGLSKLVEYSHSKE